jgi:hypothetical protein
MPMSWNEYRNKGETVEQYARRLLSDLADGDVDAALEFSCQYCSGPSSMGLCRAIRRAGSMAQTAQQQTGQDDG